MNASVSIFSGESGGLRSEKAGNQAQPLRKRAVGGRLVTKQKMLFKPGKAAAGGSCLRAQWQECCEKCAGSRDWPGAGQCSRERQAQDTCDCSCSLQPQQKQASARGWSTRVKREPHSGTSAICPPPCWGGGAHKKIKPCGSPRALLDSHKKTRGAQERLAISAIGSQT